MSTGHDPDNSVADSDTIDRIMSNEAVEKCLSKYAKINKDYDLPYLGGYSEDGETIYIDRHLPDELEFEFDGTTYTFDPVQFIRIHEETEKAVIDGLEAEYLFAHRIANGVEKRAVIAAGLPWQQYSDCLEPYIKADEHEKLEEIPPDLDWTPYYAKPVDKALIDRMRGAEGEAKRQKADNDVEYSDTRGRPSRHCGPDHDWPNNYCEYYTNYACTKVAGYIDPRGGCDLYRKAEGA